MPKPKLTTEQIRTLDPSEPPVVEVLNNGQSFFTNLKVHYCDVHPVKSWVVFGDKRGSVYLFDYLQNDLLHTFSLNSMFESKKEETNLYRTLDKNFKNVQLPYWYDEELFTKNEKFGDLKSLRFYDEHVQYWKLRQLNSMSGVDPQQVQQPQTPTPRGVVEDDDTDRSRMVGVNGAVGGASLDRPPKCIVIHTDTRIIMLRYDEVSSLLFFFDDVKSSQLDNKTITCYDFLYKQSVMAIGCSDGSIRFWDFQQRKVLNKIIPNAHSKPLSQLLTVPRDDPLSKYPGLISSSIDGNLTLWNLDSEKAEYTETKCQGHVASMVLDPHSGYLTTTGSDKSIAVRSTTTGKVIKMSKLKLPMKNLCMATACNCSPTWLLMLENKKQKRTVFVMPANLNCDQEFVDKHCMEVTDYAPEHHKDSKFYTISQHPLQPNLLFFGTSFGLMIVKMDYRRMPAVCAGYFRYDPSSLAGNSTSSLEPPSIEIENTMLAVPKTIGTTDDKKRFVLYVREKNVYQRFVETSNEGKKVFSSEKVVFNLGRVANVRIDVSYSGRYVSVLWESEKEYFVFDISKDSWRNVASERDCYNIVWSSSSDTFAILKGNFTNKKVSIKKIENSSVKLVSEALPTSSNNIEEIFGGVLLGVRFGSQHPEENGFQFFSWVGRDAFGVAGDPYLPKPEFVVWDYLTGKCLMAYKDSYAIFNYNPTFKMEYYVEEPIESAFWWNSTLFVTTQLEIKAIFVTTGRMFSTVLASFDIAFYSQISQKTPMDEQSSLDPIPLPRPKGVLSFMDVVGDTLYVLDGFSQIHSINNIGITPSIKFRMLVSAGLTKKAMEWIPFIAQEIHDYLADFLCAFGYVNEACSIDSLSSYKRLQLCLQHENIKNGLDALTYLDENRVYFRQDNVRSSNKTEEDDAELSKLYIRLGSVGEKRLNKMFSNMQNNGKQQPLYNNHLLKQTSEEALQSSMEPQVSEVNGEVLKKEEIQAIIEQCYRRAVTLDPNAYSHLVIFLANNHPEKLEEIKNDLFTKMSQSSEEGDEKLASTFRQALSMLALVSKDFVLASELLQQANMWSQAATLDNSKIDAWSQHVNSKPNTLSVHIGN